MFIIYSKCNQPQNTPQRQRPKGAYLFQAHLKRRGGGGGGFLAGGGFFFSKSGEGGGGGGGGIIWDGWLTLFRKDDGINILNKK